MTSACSSKKTVPCGQFKLQIMYVGLSVDWGGHLPAAASVPVTTKVKKDDMPELSGKSEEFKEAVRQSFEVEKAQK